MAARLALACAHAGLNVVLVDADLRRAGTSDRFGLRDQPGLGVVLAESRPVDSALVEWQLPESAVGRLRVLPAGPPASQPGRARQLRGDGASCCHHSSRTLTWSLSTRQPRSR